MITTSNLIKDMFFVTSNISYNISQNSSIIRQYILNFFPSSMFRRIISNNQDVSVEQDYRATNVNQGRYAHKLPAFAMKTNFTLEQTVTDNPENDGWMDLFRRNGIINDFRTNYLIFFSDYEREHYIGALPKRYKLTYDIGMRLESELQMWDMLNYIKHSIQFESYFYIREYMQSIIPNRVINYLACDYDLDITNDLDREKLLHILRKYSRNCISEIKNPATGERVYTHNYWQNMLVKFSVPSGDKNVKDMSTTYADIKFQVESQIMVCTNYAITLDRKREDYAQYVEHLDEVYDAPPNPGFNITIRRFLPAEQLEDGKLLIFSKGFVTNPPNSMGVVEPVYDKPLYKLYLDDPASYVDTGKDISKPREVDFKTRGNVKAAYNPLQGGWTIKLLSPDAAVNFSLDNLHFTHGRSKKFILELEVIANKAGKLLAIRTKDKKDRYRITEAGYPQKLTLPLYMRDFSNNGIAVLWNNELNHDQEEDPNFELTIKGFRIVPLLGETLSNDNTDYIYLNSALPEALLRVIHYCREHKLDITQYFKFAIAQKDKRYLNDDEIEVDWNELRLAIKNPLFNYTHYLNVYANMELYNDILYNKILHVEQPEVKEWKHEYGKHNGHK